jgi:heat shock protein HslJ
MMTIRVKAVLGMTLALAVAGCVPQQQGEGTMSNVARNLSGKWRVVTLGGGTLPPTANVTLDFAAKTVSGSSGCNNYSGSYTQKGTDLSFGPTAMTRKACPPQLMDIETGFAKALASVTAYDMNSGRLRLLVGEHVIMQAQRE